MSPIKDFTLIYEALNKEDIFTNGDTVTGLITFTLTKETEVKSLLVKIKGDASVHWSEGSGDRRRSHNDHRRYFKVKEYFIKEDAQDNVLPEGYHRFEFSLQIPQEDAPSSFKGIHGKIVYKLQAKLSRKWHLPSGVEKELKFASKSLLQPGQIKCPQAGSVSKDVGVFSKGEVQMSATINRKACFPGETLPISAKINNSSSKKVKAKFSLQQRTVYRAHASRRVVAHNLCKMVGDTIGPNSEGTASCQLKIPEDIVHTLHNCEIISVTYTIKVYVDISFSIDPEVLFPVVIVPSRFLTHQPHGDFGPYPAGAVGAPSYSDFPAPAFPVGPYPVPSGSGAYGYPAAGPSQHANIASGYNNPFQQQSAPYVFSSAAYPPSSMQHQAPTAPTVLHHGEEPPSYMSVFPPQQ
ncbi:arrestin domain-containing protein 3-like [Scomber scombrus]|uniref:Arrestin domain-containing protein 3-like n=1 Tax=Scomber scombrus TaxID=13677 RepID=A0AAV1MU51_SCOSC|nr:arrestin domain-containing protein 3-like [Scomber scombrus]